MQKMRSIGINGGELKHFLGNFSIRFSLFFQYFVNQLRLIPLKGVGGGPGRKNFFLMILIANLVYFHPLFTEFQNLDPKALNFADLSGWVRAPRGHFRPFGEIWCLKSHKTVTKCTLLIFKWLNMIQEVFPRVKIRHFVTYLQAGGSPIIIVSSIEFGPPGKAMAPKAYSGNFKKNRISQKWS